jgi:DNA-binding HxlR family transcriptional regulator
VRIEYELTDKGRALEAAIVAISTWATEWIDPVEMTAAAPAASAVHSGADGR